MNTLVLGLQWGDEGKGKAIDCLASGFDVVVRFQGGHNAGHTIYVGEQKVVLHLLPSGIFSPTTVSVIGNGVVVDPRQLLAEIDSCQKVQLDLGKLVLSESAPLIFPFHQELDVVYEAARCQNIGTTRRGIGPAYEDLIGRRSLFVRDLLDGAELRRRIVPLHDASCRLIAAGGGNPPSLDSYLNEYLECGRRLAPRVADTRALLHRLWKEGKRILFEGAQGALLDIHFGTY
ncbi:MAG TPA: adenylosuccinate synthetase, partial [Candidatus Aminicenantes bacterium]|nr:adenylosuccinate synthetase [Candidatus Aminicenantes bacterium]